MAEFDFVEESMSNRQAQAFASVARTFNGLASIAEEDPLDSDLTVYENDGQRIIETESQFAETWTEIKECVETHLEGISLDESLDQDPFDALVISGQPSANQALTLSVRYDRQGTLKVDIKNP